MKMEWLIAGIVGLIAILYLVSKSGTSANPLNAGSFAPGTSGEGEAIDGALGGASEVYSAISSGGFGSGDDYDDSDDDY